jgi:hypothetical protein
MFLSDVSIQFSHVRRWDSPASVIADFSTAGSSRVDTALGKLRNRASTKPLLTFGTTGELVRTAQSDFRAAKVETALALAIWRILAALSLSIGIGEDSQGRIRRAVVFGVTTPAILKRVSISVRDVDR